MSCPVPGCQAGPYCAGDHRTPEAQAASRALADRLDQLSAAIHDWAQPDDDLGWPGDEILRDRGNCDDLAGYLQERDLA